MTDQTKTVPTTKVIYDSKQVTVAIRSVAQQVVDRYKGKDVLFVSLLNGAPVFSTLLMMEVERLDPDFCPEVRYLNIETYGNSHTAKVPQITQPLSPKTRVRGRPAVVLDEVLDTANTVAKAEEYLLQLRVTSVDLVVLATKSRPRKVWQEATISGLEAPDLWLTGMGMDGAPGRPDEAFRFADYMLAVEQ